MLGYMASQRIKCWRVGDGSSSAADKVRDLEITGAIQSQGVLVESPP